MHGRERLMNSPGMPPWTPHLRVFFFILPVREVGTNWGVAEIGLGLLRKIWGGDPLSLQMSAGAVMTPDKGRWTATRAESGHVLGC